MTSPQSAFDLGEVRQHDMTFPVTLAEKYQPRIENFVGLAEPKRILLGLLKNPKPCSLLFVGAPGCGKTSMAMRFAEQLPAAHHHIRAQSADVATLDRMWELCQYYPARGKFHVVHIDEVDGATEKAQLQLLSRMDGTACLRPLFGGGFERGEVPPIINIFTCNGRIVDGKMTPPVALLPRFLSRCIVLYFDAVAPREMAEYLAAIWKAETGTELPMAYCEYLAQGTEGVRDALMRLDSELLAQRPPEEIAAILRANATPAPTVLPEYLREPSAPIEVAPARFRHRYDGKTAEYTYKRQAIRALREAKAGEVRTIASDRRVAWVQDGKIRVMNGCRDH